MADGESERVRRVVLGQFGQVEQRLDHPLDLLLLGEAVSADGSFHATGLVLLSIQATVEAGHLCFQVQVNAEVDLSGWSTGWTEVR